MSGRLAGLGTLLRFAARRERVRIPVYVLLFALFAVTTAVQSEQLYGTQAERDEYAATVAGNPGMVALVGPAHAVTNVGGDVAWQLGGLGGVVAALMAMAIVGRHTRAEEQAGRSELVRASPVGRLAPTVAGLAVAVAANVLLAVVLTLAMLSQDLDAAGSLAFGLSLGGVGLAFTGLALVAAQVSQTTSGAWGIVGAAVGFSYVLRAAGDVGDGTLSWLSPIGWGQAMRPFAGERWWPLLLLLGAAAVLCGAGLWLLARRDDGAGALAERPGPPRAARWVTTAAGLPLRLGRGALLGWSLGLLLSGAAIGSIAQDADSVLGDSEAVDDLVGRAGGDMVDNYLAISLQSLGMTGAAFAIAAVLRLRREEREGRAEVLLATALGRTRWAAGQLAFAVGGTVLVLGAGGLGTGVTDAIVAGDAGRIWPSLGAGLAWVPAVWVLAGLTLLLVGAVPRAAAGAWGALGAIFALGIFGPLLGLPDWLLDLSPFAHVPLLPAADGDPAALLGLTAVAAALSAAGLAALRRRDVPGG